MTLPFGAALLPWLTLAPFVAALLLAGVRNEQPKLAAWLAGLTALGALVLLLTLAPAVFAGEVLRWSVDWLPALGLRFGFRLDGLAWMFCAAGAGHWRASGAVWRLLPGRQGATRPLFRLLHVVYAAFLAGR